MDVRSSAVDGRLVCHAIAAPRESRWLAFFADGARQGDSIESIEVGRSSWRCAVGWEEVR